MNIKLNPHDVGTPTWQKIKDHFEQRLAKCRAQLEADQDHESSLKLRARIREIKEILDMGEMPNQKT